MHSRSRAVSLLTLATLIAAPSSGDQVVIEPLKDNTLYEDPNGVLSNGQGSFLFAGKILTGGMRRALLAFDVAGAVPAGATIDAVTLELNMSRTIAGSVDIGLYLALADWGEGASRATGQEGGGAPAQPGDATWLHTFFDTNRWVTRGGDYSPVPSAVVPVAGLGRYTWGSNAALVADVQSWLDDPSISFGWLLEGDPAVIPGAKQFGSKDNPIAANRPKLTIDFTTGGGCPGDLDGDGDTDLADLGILLADFGCTLPGPCVGDLDNDGDTDLADLGILLADFGCTP